MPLLGTRVAGALRMLRDPDNPDYEHDEDEE
jgi:hypothetical protein